MKMKHGDFTKLAKYYNNRPGYSENAIVALLKYIDYFSNKSFIAAEIGAGTGKLSKILGQYKVPLYSVEPNDEMRKVGITYTKKHKSIKWLKGAGEKTCLQSNHFDWVVMASSFHWTDHTKSLPEFHRILKPGGFLTVLWNPRDIREKSFHENIENIIKSHIPDLKRVSSGSKKNTKNWETVLESTGHFNNVVFIEGSHEEVMSQKRYIGIWKSVNDIQVQAGKIKFQKILKDIQNEIKSIPQIKSFYRTRSWTAQRVN